MSIILLLRPQSCGVWRVLEPLWLTSDHFLWRQNSAGLGERAIRASAGVWQGHEKHQIRTQGKWRISSVRVIQPLHMYTWGIGDQFCERIIKHIRHVHMVSGESVLWESWTVNMHTQWVGNQFCERVMNNKYNHKKSGGSFLLESHEHIRYEHWVSMGICSVR